MATWLTAETSIEVGLAKQGIASVASSWIAVGRCIVIDVIAEGLLWMERIITWELKSLYTFKNHSVLPCIA